MLLGLHTYSFHLHGMGQNWGGYKLAWEPVWDIFSLMDEAKKLGLDGLHLTAADLGQTNDGHLSNPDMQRLNLEVEFNPGDDGPEEARRREYAALVESIRFAREDLGVGKL